MNCTEFKCSLCQSRALRRRHSFGGGVPGDFDRRRWRADRFFSAAAASIKCRRRRCSSAWQAITIGPFIGRIHWAIAAPKFAPCIRPIKRVGLVLPFSSRHAHHGMNTRCIIKIVIVWIVECNTTDSLFTICLCCPKSKYRSFELAISDCDANVQFIN